MTTTPVERLNLHIAEGRLIREQWVGRLYDGRKTARILAAMAPECGRSGFASACPADIMPLWLAHVAAVDDDWGRCEPSELHRLADDLINAALAKAGREGTDHDT